MQLIWENFEKTFFAENFNYWFPNWPTLLIFVEKSVQYSISFVKKQCVISQNAILKYSLRLLWIDGFLFFVVLCECSIQSHMIFLSPILVVKFTSQKSQTNPKKPNKKYPQKIRTSLNPCFCALNMILFLFLDVAILFWLWCIKTCQNYCLILILLSLPFSL